MDSLLKEFYVIFWDQVSHDLQEVFRDQLQEGLLGAGMDRSLMTLLYKKGSGEDLKNWRPRMFLNFNYKLLAKILAEHLKSVIGTVIHEDQLCLGLGGRSTELCCS